MPRERDDPELSRQRLVAFGRRLRQLRSWSELSQDSLASRAGLSRDYIAKLEQGKMSPGLSRLWDIADALEIGIVDLLGEGLPAAWGSRASRPRPPGS